MQFIGQVTTIYFEWMPQDEPIIPYIDKYGEAYECSEGEHFSLESMVEYFDENENDEAVQIINEFIEKYGITDQAEVKWSW